MPIQFPEIARKKKFWENFGDAATAAALKTIESPSEAMARRVQAEKNQADVDEVARKNSGELTKGELLKGMENASVVEPGTPGSVAFKVRDGDTVSDVSLLPRPKTNPLEDAIKNITYQKGLKDLNSPDPAREPKQNQFDAARFGRRMELAEKTLGALEKTGFDAGAMSTAAAGLLPFDFMKPESVKSLRQAQDSFINAALRDESGASIAPHEREAARSEYFPTGGDSDDIKAQKRASRQQVLEALRAEAGDAWDRVNPVAPRTFKTKTPVADKRPAKGITDNASAAPTPPAAGPGSIVVVGGKRYKVAADGDTLEPIQ